MSDDNKILLAGGALELTVAKFEPLRAFELLDKLRQIGDEHVTSPAWFRAVLANATIIRRDEGAEPQLFSLGAGDVAINKAFRGFGLEVMTDAVIFATNYNFKSFFDAARAKADALAATAPSA